MDTHSVPTADALNVTKDVEVFYHQRGAGPYPAEVRYSGDVHCQVTPSMTKA